MESPKKRKRNIRIKIENEDSDDLPDSPEDEEEYLPSPKKKKLMKTSNKATAVKIKNEKSNKAVRKKVQSGSKEKSSATKKEIDTELDPLNIKEEIIKNENLLSKNISTVTNKLNSFSKERSFAAKKELDAKLEPLMKEEEIIRNEVRQLNPSWKDEEVVSQASCVSLEVAKNVLNLLNQDCTIPFIVRYRKQMTGGLQAEKLREIQDSYEEVKKVHKKVENILKTTKHEKFDENVAVALLNAKTLEEVDLLYAPFKPGNKRTLAERSKQLGLEPFAIQVMEGQSPLTEVKIKSFVKQQKGLENEKEILSGIQHIIADKISKDQKVLDCIRQMIRHHQIRILSSKSLTAEKADRAAFVEGKSTQNFKYENYFELNIQISNIASHQVLALNRGEKQKVLKVKIQIPHIVKKNITDFIISALFSGKYYDFHTKDFLKNCVDDAYERLIEPYMSRQIRAELTKKAERESISMFGENVKSLLLTPPVRGKTVMGIDPGFSHGCKIGVVSSKGEVLATDVIYPHSKKISNIYPDPNAEKVLKLISTHGCDIIAIGNGTACRETEVWLSNHSKSQFFHPYQVKYCIVNENGVSIYSVTKEAEYELPNMDPNLRSAVSIARRLQDPLLEYVKVEPKHLGVGMYQHDIPESQLKKALDSIVEECVSFVGVDLNVCPEVLLRKISGLSTVRAKQIVEWRTKNGCFINRQQLLEVKGLGQKSFEQCAGFVKILPETSTSCSSTTTGSKLEKKNGTYKPNPLDRTIIHPESYAIAEKFVQELGVDYSNIGQQVLVDKVNSYMNFKSIENVANEFSVPAAVMQLIIDAFKQLQDYDIRKEFDEPLFRTSIQKFSDLQSGQELTGRVTNVTGFGAFVDIGVECNGLIHISKMKGRKLNVGDRVTVNVIEVNIQKKRIGLEVKI